MSLPGIGQKVSLDNSVAFLASEICSTCLNLVAIYGTSENVAPWLCECKEIFAAQSSLQQTIVPVKKTIRIHPLVPRIGAALRRRWLDAQK